MAVLATPEQLRRRADDAWFITPDSRCVFTSRNATQSEVGPDGAMTYVLAHHDPGVPNWIETDGQRQGFLLLRWQQVPADADPGTMAGPARIVPFDRLGDTIPAGTRRVSRAERAAERTRRVRDHEHRLHA